MAERDDYPEIAGYVETFRHSSDRSRRMVFIITTICVLILVANWNLHQASWARIRMRKAAELRALGQTPQPATTATTKKNATSDQRAKAYNELVVSAYPEEYVKQMLVVQIPIVGIATDVNEIGMLGGVTLSLLMGILLLALMRQHENLYLSTFKIIRLHDHYSKERGDGESKANYLYHLLAMTQVLTSPPTLARWPVRGRRRLLSTIVKSLFLLPALIMIYVVWTNWMSPVPQFYDVSPRAKLIFQDILATLLIGLGLACWIYARAMDRRWRDAFFHINPHLLTKSPDPWLVRVKLRSRWTTREKQLRKLLEKALLSHGGSASPRSGAEVTVTVTFRIRTDLMTFDGLDVVSHQLMKAARTEARKWCATNKRFYVELDGFQMEPIAPVGHHVDVTIVWWVSHGEDAH